MDFGRLAGLDDVLEAGVRVGHDQIVVEGAGKEHGFLGDDAEGVSEFIGGEVADVLAIEIDLPFVGLVEAEQQFGQGALAAAAGAHEHGEVTGFEAQAEVAVEPGVVFGIAEGEMLEVDSSRPLVLAAGGQGMGFLRHVEDVAQAFDGDVGLLEFLPETDESQEGLAHPAGEHLEGDEHADREAVVLHDQQSANDEDAQGHDLFEAVADDVVSVADLLGGEAGSEVLGKVVAVLLVDVGFHLQGFHRSHTGNVFGEESLVAGAEHELPVELVAKYRGDEKADDGDGAEQADGDQGELPAIGKHDREEDEQEGEIEDQGNGSAGDKFPDGLHPVQTGDESAGGTVLEIGQRQTQEVAEDLAAQYGIDAVAGVQDEVLAQPAHGAGEEHEQDEGDTEDDEGALGLVYDDLIDDDLREERRSQADQLDGQAGEQDVAPDGLVLEEFGDEPVETEAGFFGFEARDGFVLTSSFAGGEDQLRLELLNSVFDSQAFRCLATTAKIDQFMPISFEDEDGNTRDFIATGLLRHSHKKGDRR